MDGICIRLEVKGLGLRPFKVRKCSKAEASLPSEHEKPFCFDCFNCFDCFDFGCFGLPLMSKKHFYQNDATIPIQTIEYSYWDCTKS